MLIDQNLITKIDCVFYFKLTLDPQCSFLICAACRAIIEDFHAFVEQVKRNLVTLSEGSRLVKQPDPVKPAWNTIQLEILCESETTGSTPQNINVLSAHSLVEAFDKFHQSWMLEENVIKTGEETQAPEVRNLNLAKEALPEMKQHSVKNKQTFFKGSEISKVSKLTPSQAEAHIDSELTNDQLVLRHYDLSCDLCLTPLTDFGELRKHYRYEHNCSGYLLCCNKKIYKKCWMIEHLQLHLNPDAFRCLLCRKSYSSSKVLKEHTKEVHATAADRTLRCDTCQKAFVSKAHLNAHIMVAHGSVPCPDCGKVLASLGSLRKHRVAMHGEGEKHVCEVCARVFRTKQCFLVHRKHHEGRRMDSRVQCGVCSVWLTDKYCLTKHMRRMHTVADCSLEPCVVCGKQLRNKDALAYHMRRAHAATRYECELCHKRFKLLHYKREHIAIYHTGEALYGCPYCTQRFSTKNKQYLHRKTVHPAEYKAEVRKRVLRE
ncbi:transcription factor grauzone-like [Anopheles bellator]|uniref:transcription factor grauzone-like n=1 Tax=Anopheles bellator TaxID=139047 RepID=UPI002646FE43|nr:transcription factor grauzone-like [Anopheles bellator]